MATDQTNLELTRSEEASTPLANRATFHVVGIGASAGGLEALERLFHQMPVDTGMAFVVVQHLSPDFVSMMDELLVRQTKLPVHTVTDGMEVEPNAIYLIPPRKEMIISGGRLLLTDKDPSQGFTLPIDLFLRSLAQDCSAQAVGVILSGTGSDGSRGIRAIHEAGGLTLVQREDTALFDGMPKSALATGVIDLVLSPEEIADALARYARHGLISGPAAGASAPAEDALQRLLRLLRELHGIDFSLYKESTVLRRIERRLMLCKSGDLEEYVRQATANPQELNSLYRDLLIGVTQFFRDREAFAALETSVLPDLLERVPPGEEFRAWVAGCATGEEAYSLAILIHEALTRLGRPPKVRIFATDVHQQSLEIASAAVYPEENLADVSPERRDRYFTRTGDHYQVSGDLRQLIVFAPHNLIKDAPFTHLDLITCRNLLIYFQPAAQRKVISLFHFGLKASGALFLGPSENVGDLEDEFTPIDRYWKIYRKRRDVRLPAEIRLPMTAAPLRRAIKAAGQPPDVELLRVYDELLDRFMPPGILINQHQQVVHVFGQAGQYLHFKTGRPSSDLLDLFDADLKTAVAGALQRARKDWASVSLTGLHLNTGNGRRQITLGVQPLGKATLEPYLLITLREEQPAPAAPESTEAINMGVVSRDRISTLEHELRTSRENLQATIEELETSNEELQATNEELIASNEELQSTNEELHSVNEELYTVNAEYQRKIVELTEMTDDLENLLQSTSIGVLFLDEKLRIRKFTAPVSQLFNILKQDIGRPLENFSHNIEFPELGERVREVLTSKAAFEREVRDRFGRCHLLRILPYRSTAQADGVIVLLVDVQMLKEAEAELRRKERELQAILNNFPALMFVKDLEGRYVLLNRQARQVFRISAEEAYGKTIGELMPAAAAEQVEQQDQQVITTGLTVQGELTLRLQGRTRTYLSIKYPLRDDTGRVINVAGFWVDITKQKKAEQQARRATEQRDRFLAMLSHELRNPLAAVQNSGYVLEQLPLAADAAEAVQTIVRQCRHMARLLDDLLDVSRISQGKLVLHKELIDLRRPAADSVHNVEQQAAVRRIALETHLPDEPLAIEGDADRLQQVQTNLLVNAIKYTPAGGKVEFSVERLDGHALISVSDTGVGMSKPLLRRIFDLFVQGNETLDRADGGMGVGLTLVRSIVDLHGGEVSAASDGPGAGSQFTVKLPLSNRSLPDAAAPAPTSSTDATGTSILLVEDNADARSILAKLLETYGYQVRTAADGQAALECLQQELPDVALVDIGLPRMNGYQVARQVRQRWPDRRLYLVALTGYGRTQDRERALEAGFDEHLTKPIHIQDLRSLLARAKPLRAANA